MCKKEWGALQLSTDVNAADFAAAVRQLGAAGTEGFLD